MCYLAEEVVEIELVLVYLLLYLAGLLLVILLLGTLHERHDVTHAEYSVGHSLGMEHLQRIGFLARGDELEGLVHHRTYRNGCTATGVTVEFGEYHSIVVEPFVELTGRIHGILTRHGIHHEEGFGRFHRLFDSLYLLHHLLVHSQTSCRIDDYRIESLLQGILHSILRNLHGIHVAVLGVDLHAYLAAKNLQLVNCRRTVDIACNQQHTTAAFALEH